jgi:sortase A
MIVHAVAAGETLAGIANAYGASVENLLQVNRIDSPSRIRIGQKIKIPTGADASRSLSPASAAVQQPTPVATTGLPPFQAPLEIGVPLSPPPPAGDPPTRIVSPKIKLDSIIVPVGWKVVRDGGRSVNVWDVADFAAGWHKGSAYPGNVGNVVVSGHHNIKGEVFRYVVDLEVGDEVDLYVQNQRYPYRVAEKHILREKGMPEEVRAANARWISQTTDERLTLVTCWPYSNNTHRVIVVARPMWK